MRILQNFPRLAFLQNIAQLAHMNILTLLAHVIVRAFRGEVLDILSVSLFTKFFLNTDLESRKRGLKPHQMYRPVLQI